MSKCNSCHHFTLSSPGIGQCMFHYRQVLDLHACTQHVPKATAKTTAEIMHDLTKTEVKGNERLSDYTKTTWDEIEGDNGGA